jgi:hypothetical protein
MYDIFFPQFIFYEDMVTETAWIINWEMHLKQCDNMLRDENRENSV